CPAVTLRCSAGAAMPAGARTRGARTRGARTRLHGVRRRCAPQGAQRWRVQRRELGTASLRRQALHHEVRGARAQAGELLRGAEGRRRVVARGALIAEPRKERARRRRERVDRKSTRLNSSHAKLSYAVFCLNKKIID